MNKKVGFPNYKRIFFLFKIPNGWEDLGERRGKFVSSDNGDVVRRYAVCSFCNIHIHLGRQDGKIFAFCPVHLKRVNNL